MATGDHETPLSNPSAPGELSTAEPGRPQEIQGHWPPRPDVFRELLTPVEAAQYLRLDETGAHTPQSAIRTMNFWRNRGELKATKYARRVWFRREELDRFLEVKTEG